MFLILTHVLPSITIYWILFAQNSLNAFVLQENLIFPFSLPFILFPQKQTTNKSVVIF